MDPRGEQGARGVRLEGPRESGADAVVKWRPEDDAEVSADLAGERAFQAWT